MESVKYIPNCLKQSHLYISYHIFNRKKKKKILKKYIPDMSLIVSYNS